MSVLPRCRRAPASAGVLVLALACSVLHASDDAFREQRLQMVAEQIARRGVGDPRVLEGMRAVPRHLFVPPKWRHAAYDDAPLPIGEGQTISQPYVVGKMTELLRLTPADTVFELGTGSGYQAAVASRIARHVYTMEIYPSLGDAAREALVALGYDNVTVRTGDGYYGWPEKAPFDAVIVTAAATHIPPPLLEQLKPGGRMVIPVGPAFSTQRLMLVEKKENGQISTRALFPVRFVPVLGEGH